MSEIKKKRLQKFESKIPGIINNENISIKKLFNINDTNGMSHNLCIQLSEFFTDIDDICNKNESDLLNKNKLSKFGI